MGGVSGITGAGANVGVASAVVTGVDVAAAAMIFANSCDGATATSLGEEAIPSRRPALELLIGDSGYVPGPRDLVPTPLRALDGAALSSEATFVGSEIGCADDALIRSSHKYRLSVLQTRS